MLREGPIGVIRDAFSYDLFDHIQKTTISMVEKDTAVHCTTYDQSLLAALAIHT